MSETHKGEGVIVQIKEDPAPIRSSVTLASAVENVVKEHSGFWNLGTTVPTLRALRGKIQLMRRYSINPYLGERPLGIDVTDWPDNSTHFEINTSSGATLVVQDAYRFDLDFEDLVRQKYSAIDNLLRQAISDPDASTWYINFASASAAGLHLYIEPKDIAVGYYEHFLYLRGINSFLQNRLYDLPSGKRLGTILMVFPESPTGDIVARIVAENFV